MGRPKRPLPGLTREERSQRRQRTWTPAAATPAPAAAAASSVSDGGEPLRALLGRCRELLVDKLLGHEDGWVFASPVDTRALGLRDYYRVIREPMDLGTVLRRLQCRRYADPREFAADVRLTFRNAMSYNEQGDPVHESAAELSEIFEAEWAPILASINPAAASDGRQPRCRIHEQIPSDGSNLK